MRKFAMIAAFPREIRRGSRMFVFDRLSGYEEAFEPW